MSKLYYYANHARKHIVSWKNINKWVKLVRSFIFPFLVIFRGGVKHHFRSVWRNPTVAVVFDFRTWAIKRKLAQVTSCWLNKGLQGLQTGVWVHPKTRVQWVRATKITWYREYARRRQVQGRRAKEPRGDLSAGKCPSGPPTPEFWCLWKKILQHFRDWGLREGLNEKKNVFFRALPER